MYHGRLDADTNMEARQNGGRNCNGGRARVSLRDNGEARRAEERTVQLPGALCVPACAEQDEVNRVAEPRDVVALQLLPVVLNVRRRGRLEDEALCEERTVESAGGGGKITRAGAREPAPSKRSTEPPKAASSSCSRSEFFSVSRRVSAKGNRRRRGRTLTAVGTPRETCIGSRAASIDQPGMTRTTCSSVARRSAYVRSMSGSPSSSRMSKKTSWRWRSLPLFCDGCDSSRARPDRASVDLQARDEARGQTQY